MPNSEQTTPLITTPALSTSGRATGTCRDCARTNEPVCWGLCEGCWGKRDRAAADLREKIEDITASGEHFDQLPALEHQLWQLSVGKGPAPQS